MTTGAAAPAGDADPLADARRRRADRARQVADVLRRQVLGGMFSSGTLPAETQLAVEFGVSRNAVRDALDVLRAEGLVHRVPGVGTVLAAPKYPHGLDHLLGLADVLRQLRAGEVTTFAAALSDPDRRVRLEAVRGLVSLAEPGLVAGAAGDGSRQVRVAVAEGLGMIGGGPATAALRQLATDADPLVRAAAFTAAGAVGCPAPLDAPAAEALHDPAWQVRVGAAQALAAAGPQLALASLGGATADPHAALTDTNADVRAYARHALAGDQPAGPAVPVS